MPSKRQKVYKDIVRLQEAVEEISNPLSARKLGINIHQIQHSLTSDQPIPFKPCLFLPFRTQKPDPNPSQECAERASHGPSSSTSSGSMSHTLSSFLRSSFPFSSSRPSSASYLSFSGCFGPDPPPTNAGDGASYPPVLEQVAKENGYALPPLTDISRSSVLKSNGPTAGGKWSYIPSLELHEDNRWEVTEILEDPTYAHPHTVVEIFMVLEHPMDGDLLSLTEIRAILRLMRIRMELAQYQHHTAVPVLALSYVRCGSEEDGECKPIRIVQAHHRGRKLVIQYVQKIDFADAGIVPAALDTFLGYHFSNPMATSTPSEKKTNGGSWLFKKWRSLVESPIGLNDHDEHNNRSEGEEGWSFRAWVNSILTQ
ncbi:uncharacterized protein BJX67DRAFT_383097 [Aspergillus lucknowensis]|uniref:Uncharacterized protein n=1 Tax=Aspergillus lucknowensis TaxID=176173 RepID=A0ABR4LKM1_9EURO